MSTKVAIIGAGFAGLSTGKLLFKLGYDVTIFEKDSEVGGVWTSSRRYPGLGTQSPGKTYALSELEMPKEYPEWPSGEQVQKYLEMYVDKFGFREVFEFNTEIKHADYSESERKWVLTTRSTLTESDGTVSERKFDYLVVANGIFSKPKMPSYEGFDEWAAAGGKMIHTSQLTSLDDVRGKNVVVIGYGKSSCDATVSVSDAAASTNVVARKIIWKVPKFIGGVNFKRIFLTRFGEGMWPYKYLRGFDKIIHGIGYPIRNLILNVTGSVISRQLQLDKLGLTPYGGLDTLAKSSISLVSEGYLERVASGKIKMNRDNEIVKLSPGKVHLKDGTILESDVIVSGAGFTQEIPFFGEELMSKITRANGDFKLFKQVLPIGVPALSFVGYNSSFLSQLSCEIAAMFVSEHIRGAIDLPTDEEQTKYVEAHLDWTAERTDGNYFKGTYVIPFSLRQMDELLEMMNLKLSRWTIFKQWLFVIDPAQYAGLYKELEQRNRPELASNTMETAYAVTRK